MNTRLIMIASGLTLAALGLPLLFAPDRCMPAIGAAAGDAERLVAQLLGGACFAFAMMNWMAKGMTLGGVYGRAIVMGNLVFYTTSALALLKLHAMLSTHPVLWVVAVVHVAFAAAFAGMLFTHPEQR